VRERDEAMAKAKQRPDSDPLPRGGADMDDGSLLLDDSLLDDLFGSSAPSEADAGPGLAGGGDAPAAPVAPSAVVPPAAPGPSDALDGGGKPLRSLTVAQLKDQLRSRGLKVSSCSGAR